MPRPTFSSRLLDGCVRLGLSIAVVVSGLPAIATPIDFNGGGIHKGEANRNQYV
jgi:hypothetical protein